MLAINKPDLRRVDRSLRLREADRRPAGPPHSPRSHPGDERRELPPQAEQASRRHALSRRFPWRLDLPTSLPLRAPDNTHRRRTFLLNTYHRLVHSCSAT